jgi:hypothetical protein
MITNNNNTGCICGGKFLQKYRVLAPKGKRRMGRKVWTSSYTSLKNNLSSR